MKDLLSRRRFEALALGIGILFCALHWWADDTPVTDTAPAMVRAVQLLEGRAQDLKFRVRGPKPANPDIVIAEIDEKSVQKYGRWPWRRGLIAKAILQMHKAGVTAIGMDMFFPDKSDDTAGEILRKVASELGPEGETKLASFKEQLEHSPDDELAAAFAQVPEAVQGVAGYFEKEASQFPEALRAEHERILSKQVLTQAAGPTPGSQWEIPIDEIPLYPYYSAQTPLAKFADASKWMGHFTVKQDPDGTLRRAMLFLRLQRPRGLLPTFELRTAALHLGAELEALYDKDQHRIVAARLRRPNGPKVLVPVETIDAKTLINFPGPGFHDSVFKRLSVSDIIDGTFKPEELKGKAVLMAVTLVGEFDQVVTPFEEVTPGIYIHASVLSNILSGDFLTRPAALRLVEMLFMLLSALALGVLLPRVNYVWKLLSILVVVGGFLVADYELFTHGFQLASVVPTVNILASAFSVIFLGYLSVDREKGRLRGAFQHYLNESVMESMLAHPEKLRLGGEKKEMTVLFSDIRGFTTLSERMTPEALVKFINSYLTPMTRIVFEQGGTLDKYIGDALMAFWGAPLDQADHAMRACRAAVQFLGKLEELKLAWRDQNLPEFDIGVGINTGPMIVGNMGSDIRFDYTVMGDSVNLASRLEGTNKEYHTRILMSEATWEQVKDQVVARRLGAVRVKGKRKPVRIYELRALGQAQGAEAEAIRAFEAGVDAFVEQRFDEAERLFKQVQATWPADASAQRYVEDIAVLKVRPPGPGWDGVFTATTK